MRIEQTIRELGKGPYPLVDMSNELIKEMAKDNWIVVSITPFETTLILLFQRMVN